MSAEVIALIDAELAADRAGFSATIKTLQAARAEIVRQDALITEPPTDDEREALLAAVREGFALDSAGEGTGLVEEDIVDRISTSAPWRNRHRGPITEAVERAVSATWAPSECLNREQNDERRSAYAADVRRILEAARDA